MTGFDTPRLRVESWSTLVSEAASRALFVEELTPLLTSKVLRHLPPSAQLAQTRDAVNQWIADRDDEVQMSTVRQRGSQKLLGLLFLAPMTEDDESNTLRIGYLFAENAWGNGYASELVAGLVAWLKPQGRPTKLIGGVAQENKASTRVLEKAGFEKTGVHAGSGEFIFVAWI
ncbi:GNAT family N-acetyltransferase [Magnetospira sp. QH-2]|uniref:GNAT family N-acetyltransferase n=1 Tax=Magnetospira sp. (strain QH-2) TaxID=1288970 RepID=UPI0003E80FD9|nr:GNAT family N-acetyltransferase [Magnetospira sp. QH-2]CCQ74280.1 Conserved protein of unknown function [Magnetospira sp. QH-2]